MAFQSFTSNINIKTSERTLAGFTLLEMLVVLATIGLLSVIAAPSFESWQERHAFKHAATSLASLAKQARMNALVHKKNMFLIAEVEDGKCVLLSDDVTCTCSHRQSCTLNDVSFVVPSARWDLKISTTNNRNKVIAFNKNGTLNFASSTTLTLSSQRFNAKLVINSLGRIKLCSLQTFSGIAPC